MTHSTDCAVREEFREELADLAQLMAENKRKAIDKAEDEFGWEYIGSGVARAAFRVPGEEQEGPVETPVHDAPCVVKLSKTLRGNQNAAEIQQYQEFPDRVRGAEPPVVVPVADWDRDNFRWLSMPEVDSGDLGVGNIRERLAEVLVKCEDIHDDNVGEMHDVPVLLDYGSDCYEVADPAEVAADIAALLRGHPGVKDGTVETKGGPYDTIKSVQFETPDAIGEGETARESSMGVERRGFKEMSVAFGPYPTASRVPVTDAAEHIASRFESAWASPRRMMTVNASTAELPGDGDRDEFYVIILAQLSKRSERPDPTTVLAMYEGLVGEARQHLSEGATTPVEVLAEDVREHFAAEFGLDGEIEGIAEFGLDVTVGADQTDVPGLEPSRVGLDFPWPFLSIDLDGSGLDAVRLGVGPYFADTAHEPELTAAADIVMDAIQGEVDVLSSPLRVSWERDDDEGTFRGVDVDLTAITIEVEVTKSGGRPIAPIRDVKVIAAIYRSMASMVRLEFPDAAQTPDTAPAPRAGQPWSAVDAAIEDALDGE